MTPSPASPWLQPETRVPAMTTLPHHLISSVIGTSCIHLQHGYLTLRLLHVHTCHPHSCHHHFWPVTGSYNPASMLVWSNPLHLPNTDGEILQKFNSDMSLPSTKSHNGFPFSCPLPRHSPHKAPVYFSSFIPHHSKLPNPPAFYFYTLSHRAFLATWIH